MSDTKYERVQTDVENLNHDEVELQNVTKIELPRQSSTPFGLVQKSLVTLILILVYFVLSIGLTFYQRWLFKDFKFPLTVVLYHLCVKFLLSTVIRCIHRCYTGRSRVLLNFRTSITKLAPTGFASGIDIGFSNWGLELVNISLYTMTKSTTIVFILIFAILLGLEKKSWSLMMIVVMISGGLFLFTYKSTQFDALGFSFLLFASLSSGIRWTFAQLIMQKSKIGLHNPVDMVFHMQPWMILSVLPFTLGFEGRKVFDGLNGLTDADNELIMWMLLKISIGAFIAFAMELSEFLVLGQTSSLTLSVAGIFKEICQLVLAVQVGGDRLTTMNILGLIMCLGGICCHVTHKFSTYSSDRMDLNGSGGSGSGGIISGNTSFDKKRSKLNDDIIPRGQRIPLLDGDEIGNSDSDDSQNDNQNSSEVIFDVLKRRDTRR